jgi:hypothetical protein
MIARFEQHISVGCATIGNQIARRKERTFHGC